MNNKIKSAVIVTLATAFFTGCAKEPPKCSDENTFLLIRQIIVKQLDGISEKELQENIKIELPRANAYDEKIKKYSCEAKLIAGDKGEFPITYESQLDDKDKHIVSIGISKYNLMVLEQTITDRIKKNHELKDSSHPQPAKSEVKPESSPEPDNEKQVITQYGQLSIISEQDEIQLMFNGKKLRDGDGFSLSFEKRFVSGNKDIILVMNNSGGTACPVQYFFVTLNSEDSVEMTPEFGTCSDLIETSQSGEDIFVTMPESSGQQSKYVYNNGVVSENGAPLK